MNHTKPTQTRIGLLHRFVRAQGGIAAVEFIFVMPFLVTLLFGGIEITRALLIKQRFERAAYELSNIIMQYNGPSGLCDGTTPVANELTESEFDTNIFPAFQRMMGTFGDRSRQAIIVTSIQRLQNGGAIQGIRWQKASALDTLSGCDVFGNCVRSIVNGLAPSAITVAVKGTSPSFPSDISNTVGSFNVSGIWGYSVIEVFYYYQPILQTLLQNLTSALGTPFFVSERYFVSRIFMKPRNEFSCRLLPTFTYP